MRHKVIFLDEATSSIDYKTDQVVTETLAEEFVYSTMLVIGEHRGCPIPSLTDGVALAHRLRTIITFDRVLVIHEGKVAEYGKPETLLMDSKSRFHGMCKAVRFPLSNLCEREADSLLNDLEREAGIRNAPAVV